MKKFLVLALILTAMSGILVANTTFVKAEEGDTNFPPIMQRLVEKFNLDSGEVEEVFNEFREEKHQEMEARFEERLDEAVTEGKLTEEQKEALLEKKAEMQERREGLKGLSWEERKVAMQELRQEMKDWAEEIGIDLRMLRSGLRSFGGYKFGPKSGGFCPKVEI